MRLLPAELRSRYRIATSRIVRSWSFGTLKSNRRDPALPWHEWRGSFQDEAIFGPTRDFECVCGKFRGERYKGMICDKCGVKITTTDSRRTRFAHIELPVTEQHPFGNPADQLEAFPVIPAAFVESAVGGHLAETYELLVSACKCRNRPGIRDAVNQVVDLLLPVALQVHAWNLPESVTFARGLALECLDASERVDERCTTCGYALGGLTVSACPGCGRRLDG